MCQIVRRYVCLRTKQKRLQSLAGLINYFLFVFVWETQLHNDTTSVWRCASTVPVNYQVAVGNTVLVVCRSRSDGQVRELAQSTYNRVSVELAITTSNPDDYQFGANRGEVKDAQARFSLHRSMRPFSGKITPYRRKCTTSVQFTTTRVTQGIRWLYYCSYHAYIRTKGIIQTNTSLVKNICCWNRTCSHF